MNKEVYNKLIRDKIPEIISVNGDKSKTRILGEAEYIDALLEKIVEEAKEVKQAKGNRKELVKELGDVREVISFIMKSQEISEDEVASIQKQRRETRGGFDERIFLEYTEK